VTADKVVLASGRYLEGVAHAEEERVRDVVHVGRGHVEDAPVAARDEIGGVDPE